MLIVKLYLYTNCHFQEEPEYRLTLIFHLQHLTILDQVEVSAEEKV